LHDPRTLVLLFVVPPILLTILKYAFDDKTMVFDNIAPMLLGIFPMIMMFLITSIVTLRERSSGTLDRLMTMSISKSDLIFGYAIVFGLLGLLQSIFTVVVMYNLLGVTVLGGILPTIIAAVLSASLGTALGLFMSAFASSEFQAIQFMPAFIFPQLLTCGLFVARSDMAEPLRWFSNIMPLTYSVDAMKQVTDNASWTNDLTIDLLIVAGCVIAALILGSVTIHRQDSR
jgi:ABC-2 type transport system permease protein